MITYVKYNCPNWQNIPNSAMYKQKYIYKLNILAQFGITKIV